MIDLPSYGYASFKVTPIDPAGVVEGALGGPSSIIDRPGYRYSVQFTLPHMPAAGARVFQSLLERGARDDVSYPWPLDEAATAPAGAPLVNGASPAGAVIPIKGLPPSYQVKQGQAVAVISGGVGFVHRATATTAASGTGTMTLPVFPITRQGFLNGDAVEIVSPRIRGVLSWNGSDQGSWGGRPFTFTITERI